ncbi:hypothetical protein TNCV_3212191 [Trichonephila clavipes]|nr:hypothetical protein TNCV_3212191 [Trichonephila clavipes]
MSKRCSQSIFYSQRHRRSSSFHSNLGLSPFLYKSLPVRSNQGSPLMPSPSRAGLFPGCVHNTPLVPSYWQVTKVSLASLVLFAHNTPKHTRAVWPKRHNSLSNIWTHLSITPPVSIIPFSQHQKDDMILLRQASPIVNGVPALLYHYGDPSGCRHSPSSDNKQWPHGHVHWSFYSWWILKIQGQSMGVRSQQSKTSYLSLNSW